MDSFSSAHEQAPVQPLSLGDAEPYAWPTEQPQKSTPDEQELPVHMRAQPPEATGERPIGTVYGSRAARHAQTVAANPAETSHVVSEKAKRIGKRIIAVSTIGAVGLLGAAIGIDRKQHDATAKNMPTAAAIAEVNQRLQAADVPAKPQGVSQKTFDTAQKTFAGQQRMKFLRRQQIAKRDGVTVFDPTSTLVALTQHRNEQSDLSPLEAVSVANTYMRQYGDPIGIETAEKTKGYANNIQPATLAALATPNARTKLIDMVNARAGMPKEFTDATGVNRILLGQQKPGTTIDTGAYTYTDPAEAYYKDIIINMSSGPNASTLAHEYAHQWDRELSGSSERMDNDKPFHAAINNAPYGNQLDAKGTYQITAHKDGYHTYDEFKEVRNQQETAVAMHAGQASCAAIARQGNHIVHDMAAKTAFYNTYGGSEVAENYAVIGAVMASGEASDELYSDILSTQLPLLKNQLVFELGRLSRAGESAIKSRNFLIDAATKHDEQAVNDLNTLCEHPELGS